MESTGTLRIWWREESLGDKVVSLAGPTFFAMVILFFPFWVKNDGGETLVEVLAAQWEVPIAIPTITAISFGIAVFAALAAVNAWSGGRKIKERHRKEQVVLSHCSRARNIHVGPSTITWEEDGEERWGIVARDTLCLPAN